MEHQAVSPAEEVKGLPALDFDVTDPNGWYRYVADSLVLTGLSRRADISHLGISVQCTRQVATDVVTDLGRDLLRHVRHQTASRQATYDSSTFWSC